jgi:hypothetical protein
MPQKQNVHVYVSVDNHEYARIIMPQILKQECVKHLTVFCFTNESYLTGIINMLSVKYNKPINTIVVTKASNREKWLQNQFGQSEFSDDIIVYFGEKICFVDENCIDHLSKYIESHPNIDLVHPAIANTEKTTYMLQVVNHISPHLLWRWDTEYFDEYSFKNTPILFHEHVHESFLTGVPTHKLSEYDFGCYTMSNSEVQIYQAFAVSSKKLSTILKSNKTRNLFTPQIKNEGNNVILGNSWCAWMGEPWHINDINQSKWLARYAKLSGFLTEDTILAMDSDDSLETAFPFGMLFPKDDRIYIGISSHVNTLQKTLPILLKSLDEAKIPHENVLITVGGANKEKIEKHSGIIYSYVTHNSFDHNVLIDIIEKDWGGKYWFVTHDTVKFGADFYSKLQSFGTDADHIAVLKEGWLNCGLFSRDAIFEMKNYILQLKNMNKMQAVLSERVYTRLVSRVKHYGTVSDFNFPYFGNIYGDNVERLVMYMPSIDWYKFQSYSYHSKATEKLINEWMWNNDSM